MVTDLFSRRVVGMAIASSPDAELICRALNNALETRHIEGRLVFHSDQGSQYRSKKFRRLLWPPSICPVVDTSHTGDVVAGRPAVPCSTCCHRYGVGACSFSCVPDWSFDYIAITNRRSSIGASMRSENKNATSPCALGTRWERGGSMGYWYSFNHS
ncbi:integrase-like protein [Xenorhabdus ehlersii]|uniref:Integrase-like protein n=1 Tax=Xenorhabdus ehlersii TaxID=290111 RepID=A0A2D0IJW9_9GAMM|nr:transposase OrfAB, subunit B [Xenorhabdus sp. TS4]PHM22074.1 transposase OrfAB, subunit B [Xenorhabdus ehlersii]RKE90675.1 integrase-like protein [Xenorhabdus ehlersii]